MLLSKNERGTGGEEEQTPVEAAALFEVVEREPFDRGELEALYAIFGLYAGVVAVVACLGRVIFVLALILVVIWVYPSLDTARGRKGQLGVEGQLEKACNRDKLESAMFVYGKVREDSDGDLAVAVVKGVCLTDDLYVAILWVLVLGG